MIKIYLFLIVMGVLGAVGYGGYLYYKDTQQRIATLTENNAKLETAITNPNGVQSDTGTKSGDGDKDSKDGSPDSSKTKTSPAQ